MFESEKEDYYKPVKITTSVSSNFNKYESNGDKNETLSVKECNEKIEPYLKNIVNSLKSSTWNQLRSTLISFKETEETYVMHSKSDKKEVIIGNKINEIIKELFKSLLSRYRMRRMKGSN